MTETPGVLAPGTLVVDVSNYTGLLSQVMLACWKAQGVGAVIVQAITPPPGYPPSVTTHQCQAVIDAGLLLEAYVWLWWSDTSLARLRHDIALLDGFPVRRLWVDMERAQGDGIEQLSIPQRIQLAHRALQLAGGPDYAGVYTGGWFWIPAMQNTDAFAGQGYPLWTAQFGPADAPFAAYGGWAKCQYLQYEERSSAAPFCGASSLDISVVR